MLSAQAVGGMVLFIVVSSVFHPQIERAIRSAWSMLNAPPGQNEGTSTDGPLTATAQPRTLFTTSQQNLKSKSSTSTKLDRRAFSQVDQIMASITGFGQSTPTPNVPSVPAILECSTPEPAIPDPVFVLPAEPAAPSAPDACCVASQHDLSNPRKSCTSSDFNKVDFRLPQQPEVTSLFSGNPCPPPITTFATSSRDFTFCITNPPSGNRDPDISPQTVDVNELVAALSANPNLKKSKCQDLTKGSLKSEPDLGGHDLPNPVVLQNQFPKPLKTSRSKIKDQNKNLGSATRDLCQDQTNRIGLAVLENQFPNTLLTTMSKSQDPSKCVGSAAQNQPNRFGLVALENKFPNTLRTTISKTQDQTKSLGSIPDETMLETCQDLANSLSLAVRDCQLPNNLKSTIAKIQHPATGQTIVGTCPDLPNHLESSILENKIMSSSLKVVMPKSQDLTKSLVSKTNEAIIGTCQALPNPLESATFDSRFRSETLGATIPCHDLPNDLCSTGIRLEPANTLESTSPGCQNQPVTIGPTPISDIQPKTCLSAEKHVSIVPSKKGLVKESSLTLDTTESTHDLSLVSTVKETSNQTPSIDQDTTSMDNLTLSSPTFFSSTETDLSFAIECLSCKETTSETAICLQAPVLVSTPAKLTASKSATSQRSKTKLERKPTF